MNRVAIYLRVSTTRQASDGISLAEQRARLEGYARDHRWTLDGIYSDAGVSAKSLQRPEMQRLLADAKAGKFSRVLAFDLTRITRDSGDWATVQKLLRQSRVTLTLLNADAPDTPSGRAMLGMQAVFAQYQREEIAARAKAVCEFKQSRRQAWSSPPFGFRLDRDGRSLVPDASEIRALREMHRLHILGGSTREIGKLLEAKGMRSKSGRSWSSKVIWYTLRNLRPGGAYDRLGVRV